MQHVRLKNAVLVSLMYIALSITMIAPAVRAHYAEGVNHPGSYFESVYIEKGIGVDDYVTMIDYAIMGRSYGTYDGMPSGVGWGLWNPDADLCEDGFIEMMDYWAVSMYWGVNYHYTPFVSEFAQIPMLLPVPLSTAVKVGEQFTIDIMIVNVQGLNTYEFTISWTPGLLAVVSVEGGGFVSEKDFPVPSIIGEGYLYAGDELVSWPPITQSGTGFLATITFQCLSEGKTTLDLSSRLFNVDLNPMPHQNFDGSVKQKT